jgi:outer membrane protein TolC
MRSMIGPLSTFAGLALLVGAAGRLGAQAVSSDLMTAFSRRPLAELVQELPGRGTSVDDLVTLALERNLRLEASRIRRRLAEAGVDVQGGDFDLAFSLGAGLAKNRLLTDRNGRYGARLDQILPWGTAIGLDLTGTRSPSFTGSGSSYDTDMGLSLSQPLMEGFRTRATDFRVARLLSEASIHRLSRAVATVTADVELAYWNLAEAEAFQAVLQRSHEIAGALLFRNEELAVRKLVAEVDVITARSAVALRRSILVDARRARVDAAEAMIFLVWGEGAERELSRDTLPLKTVPVDITMPEVLSLENAEAAAVEGRRDLAAARSDLRGAEVAAESARNARLPLLSLDGSVRTGGTRSSLGGSLGAINQGWSWSLGVNFVQPLRNRRDRGLDQIADLTRQLKRTDLILIENLVRRDVREAVRAILAGGERLEAAEEAAALAGAQLEAEQRRLDLGLGDSFRLLQTEENAVKAELESVRARYDLARALTRYRLALGEVANR